MAKKASPHRRLIISKNLILMLVMLAIIALSSVAWFTIHAQVSAEGMYVQASRSADIELALPGENGVFPEDSAFSESINFQEGNDLLNKLFKDITSDGTQFVNPSFESATSIKDGRTVIPDGIWTEGLSSMAALLGNDDTYDDELYNYVSFDFYIRSSSKNINLNRDSYVAAQSEIEGKPLKTSGKDTGNTLTNPATCNSNNSFSADGIVGALRLSLHVKNVESVTDNGHNVNCASGENTLVWLPRPDIHLFTGSNSTDGENVWDLNTGILPTDSTYAKETYRHSFYRGTTSGSGNNIVRKGVTKQIWYDSDTLNSVLAGVSDSSAKTALQNSYQSDSAQAETTFKVSNIPASDYAKLTSKNSLSGNYGYYPKFGQEARISNSNYTPSSGNGMIHLGSKDYYVYKVTLNLWIEGVDHEARRAMNDGKFKMMLYFDAN